jgi:hypothetical protein
MPFQPYLSVKQCDAMGVWIHGDGKGETLNLQLATPREYMHAYGEHYVTIYFTGWRYFEIPLRERDADKHRDYEWPYSGLASIYMTPIDRNHISELNLYLNNLPPNDTATVYLSPIKALRTSRGRIVNPTIDLNGQKLTLPTTLASGDYMELGSIDDCRVYDERGTLLRRLALKGQPLLLKAGDNRIMFSCDRLGGASSRADVTVITAGTPLSGRTPAEQINWQLLRDEYDAPRVVTKIDGRENAWEVICRKGDKPLPFGVEIDVEQVKASDAASNRPAPPTPAARLLRNPELTIGTKRLTFPAELSTGDRLVFDGRNCRLYRKAQSEPELIRPLGAPVTLQHGRNLVVLSFGSDPLPQFRVAVSLVKHYP